MEEIKPSQLWNACSKSKIQQKTDFHIIWNISSFFTKMRQILALGGGRGRQFENCLTETKYEQMLFRTWPLVCNGLWQRWEFKWVRGELTYPQGVGLLVGY